jgi:hypothetical protein
MPRMADFELHSSDSARRRFRMEQGDAVEWTFDGDRDAWDGATRPHGERRRSGPLPFARRPQSAQALPPANPYHGVEGARRADDVRRTLRAAVEAWWQQQRLPDPSLLRDGLLVLEAGHPLDDTQRTLLARASLAHDLGVVTALRYQPDATHRAGLLREAVLDGLASPARLAALRDEPSLEPGWAPLLLAELRADRFNPNLLAAQRAADAVAVLASERTPLPTDYALELDAEGDRVWPTALAALILFVVVALIWWLRVRQPAFGDVVAIPAGVYTVSADADGAFSGQLLPRRIELPAYVIDRTEVTNAAYRRCYSAGACPWPARQDSATRTDYFLDRTYAEYPVLWIDWDSAQAYCAWRGMRLPSPEEWEVAAAYAPATGRFYRYPWGHEWDPMRVVGGGGFTDTAPVGSRSPQGDSPWGVADLAGNVAEWTSSVSTTHPDLAMIRGGSWRSPPRDLLPTALQLVRKHAANDVIGFRCAALQ